MKNNENSEAEIVLCTDVYKTSPSMQTAVSLVGSLPNRMLKYSKRLIDEPDDLFFITVNPPPSFLTSEYDIEGNQIPLCLLNLVAQWKFCQELLCSVTPALWKWFEDLIIVPEKTLQGVIHFHCIGRVKTDDNMLCDLPRLFWRMFDITIKNPNNSQELRRFNDITKHMVDYKPIEDDGIIDYLFDKDKKSYETIMNTKLKGAYPFRVLYLRVMENSI